MVVQVADCEACDVACGVLVVLLVFLPVVGGSRRCYGC